MRPIATVGIGSSAGGHVAFEVNCVGGGLGANLTIGAGPFKVSVVDVGRGFRNLFSFSA